MQDMAVSDPASVATTAKPTKVRYIILAVLALGTMINYLDRTVLGIAAPSLTKELGIDAAVMGVVFSAFSWTYVIAQVPGGIFLDRFGSKLTYTLALALWSLFTLLQAFSTGFYSLFGYRLGLGVAESPCFPTNSRIVATWFPQKERALATGIYTVGEYVGLAAFGPLLFWLMGSYGWKSLFIAVGGAGILFSLLFYAVYHEPCDSHSANQAELDYISAGGGITGQAVTSAPFTWANCKKLLAFRQIWGAAIGQYAGNTALIFFLTWFPTYLATARHMGWVKMGFFAILPFLAAAVGILVGGWVSDLLLEKTGSANIARKGPIIFGLLMASTIITANWVDSDNAVIAILSLAFFGQGMVGLGWALISDMAPKEMVGVTGGFFNLCANLAGIITPIVIGLILSATGSFVWALTFIGVVALIGAFAYIFILGDVKRLEIS